jgi:hypothetical protein
MVNLTSTVLVRAMSYRVPQLGYLDAIHLASADPFRTKLTEFVTYDHELTQYLPPVQAPVLKVTRVCHMLTNDLDYYDLGVLLHPPGSRPALRRIIRQANTLGSPSASTPSRPPDHPGHQSHRRVPIRS